MTFHVHSFWIIKMYLCTLLETYQWKNFSVWVSSNSLEAKGLLEFPENIFVIVSVSRSVQ